MSQKVILITNDDGFDSPALMALKEALSPLGRVVVVAPAHEKSANSHCMSLSKCMKFVKISDDFYKLDDGTPTDCVYLALAEILQKAPDLVVSGINIGSNMGEDVGYSGTAAGAAEGAVRGIPSVAFSQVLRDKTLGRGDFDYALAKRAAFSIAKAILDGDFPLSAREFLNVNIPQLEIEQCRGMVATELGFRVYGNAAHAHTNPRGERHFWLGLHPLKWARRSALATRAAIASLQCSTNQNSENNQNSQNGENTLNHKTDSIKQNIQNGFDGLCFGDLKDCKASDLGILNEKTFESLKVDLQANLDSIESKSKEMPIMCDFDAVFLGFISISPILLDYTAREKISTLQKWVSSQKIGDF